VINAIDDWKREVHKEYKFGFESPAPDYSFTKINICLAELGDYLLGGRSNFEDVVWTFYNEDHRSVFVFRNEADAVKMRLLL
jgi:hypothetical protein